MIFIILAQLIFWICQILIIILIVRSVLSIMIYSGRRYNPTVNRVYGILFAITEPLVAPVRRLIARFTNTGPIDIAPLATFVIILIISRILTAILFGLAGAVG